MPTREARATCKSHANGPGRAGPRSRPAHASRMPTSNGRASRPPEQAPGPRARAGGPCTCKKHANRHTIHRPGPEQAPGVSPVHGVVGVVGMVRRSRSRGARAHGNRSHTQTPRGGDTDGHGPGGPRGCPPLVVLSALSALVGSPGVGALRTAPITPYTRATRRAPRVGACAAGPGCGLIGARISDPGQWRPSNR